MSMILKQAARARIPTPGFGAGLSRIGSVRTIMEPSKIQVRSYFLHTPALLPHLTRPPPNSILHRQRHQEQVAQEK